MLNAAGVKVTDAELVPQVYLPERKGSLQVEMLAAARRHGMVSYQLAPRFEDVLREIASGTPVVVLQNLGMFSERLALRGGDRIRLRERLAGDALRDSERDMLPFGVHEVVWMRGGYWAMVVVPPDKIPATAEENRWLAAIAALERAARPRATASPTQPFSAAGRRTSNAAVGLANAHHASASCRKPRACCARRRARRIRWSC